MEEDNNALVVANDNAAGGQLQVYDMTKILTMPKEEFVEFFLQPVQDDTWIRREDIVKIEDYIASPGGEEIKKEILREYIEKREALGIKREDKILEGMAYQQKVLENYMLNDQESASRKVSGYRHFMMNNFRRRHPDFKPTPPFGEEPMETKKDSDSDEDDEAGESSAAKKRPASHRKSDFTETTEQSEAAAHPEPEGEEEGAAAPGEEPVAPATEFCAPPESNNASEEPSNEQKANAEE